MMGMSAFYTNRSCDENNIAVFQEAVNKGVTLFNSATFYGPLNEEGYGTNLRLLKKCLEGIDRSKLTIMIKVAMDTRCPVEKTGTVWVNRGSEEGIRADVEYALEAAGLDYIDIVVLCRVPFDIPLEESMRGLQAMVNEGKARAIGLSEASAMTIRKAHAMFPVQYIEQEWSMWTRDCEEQIVPTCRELGIKIVAYSPLGRGFLTGSLTQSEVENSLDPNDYRKHNPRFQGENLQQNEKIVDGIRRIAERIGCSVSQLALAWLHAQGPDVIPIPGTTSIAHLHDNLGALDIELNEDDLAEIEAILDASPVAGDRYPHMAITFHGNK